MSALAPVHTSRDLNLCSRAAKGTEGDSLRCRPLRTIASSSAPSAALFREGRCRRDGATGTTERACCGGTTARRSSSQLFLLAVSSAAWTARRCAPQGGADIRLPCAQWARSWHVAEAAKEGMAGVVTRIIDTSSSQPGASVSRFPVRTITRFRFVTSGRRSLGCAVPTRRDSGPIRKPGRHRSCVAAERRLAYNR